MQDPLLKQNIQEYDAFKIPPNINICKNHARANRVSKQNYQTFNICPCCNMSIDNKQFSLNCTEQQLAFLGSGYAFYFVFLKKCIFMISMLFIFGGLTNILIVNWTCKENCATMLGIGIFNYDNLQKQIMGQSILTTFVSLSMLILILFQIKPQMYEQIINFNEQTANISNYSIMVTNLPQNTTENEIKQYFEQLTKFKVAKINITYDIQEYKSLFEQKVQITSNIYKHKKQIEFLEGQVGKETEKFKIEMDLIVLTNRCKTIDENMNHFVESCNEQQEHEKMSSKFTGTVFITFQGQLPVQVLIKQWGVNYFRNIQYLTLNRCMKPYLQYKGQTILIRKASDPTDIIWENLRFYYVLEFMNYVVLFSLSILILMLSFELQWIVVQKVYKLKAEMTSNTSSNIIIIQIQSYMVSGLTILTNQVLNTFVDYFTRLQRHSSLTRFNKNYISIYIFLYFFNSAFMPYLINTLIKSSNPEQLVLDIHLILIANVVIGPLLKLFDVNKLLNLYKRYIIQKQMDQCQETQFMANKYFQGHDFDLKEQYAYVVRVLYLCFWYGSVAPTGIFICIIGLIISLLMDKYTFLRQNCFPHHQTAEIIIKIVEYLEILPYLYILGAIQFTHRTIISTHLVEYLTSMLVLGFTSVSMLVCSIFYLLFSNVKKFKNDNFSDLKYDDAKYLFLNEYDRVNPMTKISAINKWIEFLKQADSKKNKGQINLLRQISFTTGSHSQLINFISQRKGSINTIANLQDNPLKRLDEIELDVIQQK